MASADAMLREISVRGLGVIEEISVDFAPGMTALTGETGAGKTLVVGALELLVGGRADPAMVRTGSNAALVEGRFEVGDEEIILAREVPASGRSRAWHGTRMATASSLAEIGSTLLELHGQHDHMSLLRAEGQRAALDAYAGIDGAVLSAARGELAACIAAMAALGGDPGTRLREADFLRYQIDELERGAIDDPDEEDRLAEEEDLLAAANNHRDAAARAIMAIGSGNPDGQAGSAASALENLAAAFTYLSGHAPFSTAEERLRSLAEEIADVGHELRDGLEALHEDPERLAEVRARRQLLFDLARKYGGSLDEARRYALNATERLENIENHDSQARELARCHEIALAAVAAAEAEVRRLRANAAPALADGVTQQLRTLAMPKATVEVTIGGSGAGDEVCFLLGANPGEPLLPLSKVASGGELARATLAVRLVSSGGPPTLVFDEVDAGIGGEAALAVGKALAALSTDHQVVVVTHLAQVAAFADHQVVVTKTSERHGTVTRVGPVEGTDRIVELSRMLSGQPESDAARRHAKELLTAAAAMRGRTNRG